MRRMLMLASGLAGAFTALSASATPTQAIHRDNTSAAPGRTELAEATSPSSATAGTAPAPVAVDTRPLPPVDAPAASAPAASPAPRATPVPASPPPPRPEGRMVATGKVVKATRMYRDYVVQKGDHLFAIARDFQTTADDLVDANDLKSANQLRPGQHLKIPIEKAYVAESGDTLAAVAKRFSVSVEDLADLNDLPIRGRLRPGDRIALPAHFDDHGPFRMAPELAVARPPRRAAPTSVYSAGPYVPSQAAIAEGERRRAEEQAGGPQPPATPYRPTTLEAPPPTPADVIAAGQGRFIWPVKGDLLSDFGVKGLGRKNDGIDVKAAQGTPIHAAASGEVVYSGDQVPGFGNLVLIKHADGWVTAYAHLDHSLVHMRQTVIQGEEIGEVGLSGGVTEPQLHFEVRYAAKPTDKAKPIDPQLVLPK